MEIEDIDRKDFKTRNGNIFNLPVDYELDESNGDLFGIVEIPFHSFSYDSNKKISTQRGGQIFTDKKKLEMIEGLQELFTQSLGGRGPGGPGGNPGHLRSQLRQNIIDRIINDINDELGIDNAIDVKLKLSQTGLYISFTQSGQYSDFQNFHLSIHDTTFNPQGRNRSMAHTQGTLRTVNHRQGYPNNVHDVRSKLKLELVGWDPKNPDNFPPFRFKLILEDGTSTTAPYAKRIIVKTVNALNDLLFIRQIKRITNTDGTITWQLDPPLISQSTTNVSAVGGGYKRRKNKKSTKKKSKKLKKKSRRSKKQKRKSRRINKKKNKITIK